MIHPKYLPFAAEELREHFVGNAEKQSAYFQRSAERYLALATGGTAFLSLPIHLAKGPCQIEKDERFWTATCLKRFVEAPNAREALRALLMRSFGDKPPLDGFTSWDECLSGELRLILEAVLPAPRQYLAWLRQNIGERHMIPYVRRAAESAGAQALEGPTHVDGIILNEANGFALCIEAKVLSDISVTVSFDAFRNQLIRNLDVMLESHLTLARPLSARRPEASLFALLTPEPFKKYPQSRLYGWLMKEYMTSPTALRRDLEHREGLDTARLAQRMAWITFEDIVALVPDACPWFTEVNVSADR
jgi:hypothetical protein